MYLAVPSLPPPTGRAKTPESVMATTARIDELQKKFEENPRRYFAPLANEYRKAGDIQQAIDICRAYLPQQPGHMSGHIVYGQALYESRQFEEAKTVFETALSLDPENLIALRHLGDIALITGDSARARGWYSRVLEADPRNEEIQAQLATIDQAAAAATAPTATTGAPVASSAQTPVSAPAVERPSTPASPASAPTVVVSAVRTPPPPAVEAHAPPASELTPAPAASFSLKGLETTSLAQSAVGAETAAPAFETPAPPAAPPEPVPAPPSAAPLPELELADAPAVHVTEPPVAAAPPPEPHVAEVPVLDLEPEAAAPPPTADLPMLDVGEPEPPAAAPAPDASPFVTETMAELYLRQGHREEALRVYRALLDQRPHDASLRAKLRVLESPPVAMAAPAPMPQPTPTPRPGPFMPPPMRRERAPSTIREILSVVALRRPGFRPTSTFLVPQPVSLAPQPPPAQPQTTRAMHPQTGNGALPTAELSRPLAPVGTDAIAAIFGNAHVLPADESAAMTLAAAFSASNGGGPSPGVSSESRELSGAPARPAANELSLDSVFGGGQPAPAAPSSFSFDQFFSKRATAEHPTDMDAPNRAAADAQNDVAKFTQWLEGLKQR